MKRLDDDEMPALEGDVVVFRHGKVYVAGIVSSVYEKVAIYANVGPEMTVAIDGSRSFIGRQELLDMSVVNELLKKKYTFKDVDEARAHLRPAVIT